jgi:HD-like signal output (HDOD) protein
MPHSADTKATSILELVSQTVELPTIPTVLVRLNEVTSNPDTAAEDVAKVIAADPAVAANILRIVNSAYYGLKVRVSSVSLAVSIMGFHMTRKVALKAAVFSVFARKREQLARHFEPERFWRHSIYTGVAARVLAEASGTFQDVHPEDAYVAGLLHDIGKIILLENRAKEFAGILEAAAQAKVHSLEVEQSQLGFTHADVGSVLAIKWFLPEDLTVAIRYHHNPKKDPFHRSLSSLIHLADTMAWQNGFESLQGIAPPPLHKECLGQVGLTQEQVKALRPRIDAQYAENGSVW